MFAEARAANGFVITDNGRGIKGLPTSPGFAVTCDLFGKSRRPAWKRFFRRSPIDSFARLGTGIDVYEVETGH